ncbi:hypothetical protein CkaCkLH20_11376 [Colletotrichum karsti]|uniref:SMP-30/Gluconolactonase/LRE-like region domain-containing protein n=1 Tax=Colletotrichum karsti TaxID=1095194 RepID=A0A9P6HWC7_9PEZI|nr:uncharacterized protein CkaCkLH20_11376 [Colletotrichum karsti]KAF9871207.1 hypothetical protein CkaCkLH20_11376 [Colletotrichum karsti]
MFIRNRTIQALGLVVTSLLAAVESVPTAQCDQRIAGNVTTLHTVPGTTSLENLAIRSNGNILVSSVNSPTLYQLSPKNEHPPTAIAEIADVTGLLGISELEHDIFYVVGSNLTATENSNGVWKVDLRKSQISRNGTVTQPAEVSLVRRIPQALQLNGMSRLAANDTAHLLISDSALGTVSLLNVETGDFDTVLEEPEMAPLASGLSIGVNGIRIRGNNLYFVSLDQGLFARVTISLADGSAIGPVETLASNITFGDDFTLSKDGKRAYVATNGPREVLEIDVIKGGQTVLASSPLLSAASSVAVDMFRPEGLLYVTGGVANGNGTVGHVARVNLQCI